MMALALGCSHCVSSRLRTCVDFGLFGFFFFFFLSLSFQLRFHFLLVFIILCVFVCFALTWFSEVWLLLCQAMEEGRL